MQLSLRKRLLIATAVAALAALVVVDVITYVVISRAELQQVDDSLARSQVPIKALATDGGPAALDAIAAIAPDTYVAILDADGDALFVSPIDRPGDDPVSIDPAELAATAASLNLSSPRSATIDAGDNDAARFRFDALPDGRVLITARSLHEIDETRQNLLVVLIVATLAAVLVVVGLGWWLIGIGLRPLRLVEAEARAISDDDLAERRVPGDESPTEVGQLAAAINSMLDRLQGARDEREAMVTELQSSEARMRRFVADASHELRTPVAATAAYAELFERGARNHPDDLDRAMSGIRTETARMSGLIDDLLSLARMSDSQGERFATVDLTEVVLESIDAASVISPDRVVPIISDVVMVMGDRSQLRQVVDNLISNVRTHTPADTTCWIALGGNSTTATLVVSDDGPGLSDEQLDHVFERFYRADPARSRTAGGNGLGLSIVQAIITGHSGSIVAAHSSRGGLEITTELPIATTSPDPDPDREARA